MGVFSPLLMRSSRRFATSLLVASATLLSSLPIASALEGLGPRVTVTGTVLEVQLTEKQAFDKVGGTLVLKATNGQIVTIAITKDSEIISEGRLSRKLLVPSNIEAGMQVRARGWRSSTSSITASLIVLLSIEANPDLSGNGTISSIGDNAVTLLSQDGKARTYRITNESEINISYSVFGFRGLSLIGKKAVLTLNPTDAGAVRILRISDADPAQTIKPPSIR